MLVLSRKVQEVICLGEGDDLIKITVVRLNSENVRLGIEAKKHIPIVREELVTKPVPEEQLNG